MNSLHAKIVYDKAPIDDIVLIYDGVCFVFAVLDVHCGIIIEKGEGFG